VRRYLKEFLNDPRVIDLPAWIRWPLVNLLVIPLRYKKSAAAYQKIWHKQGSPLLFYSLKCKEALAAALGDEYQVELGMRYGQPSIASALEKLKGASSIDVIPLFPQYSSAATGSAVEKFMQLFATQWNIPELRIKKDFYAHAGFISAYAELIKNNIQNKSIDYILFSYHGLPERHIIKSTLQANNDFCYRTQCLSTTDLLVKHLGLPSNQYSTSFQSRLGRTPWIKPYTDLVLPELREKGIKNLAVVCPSFVADCLETVEEIDIRAREQWLALGGSSFTFIPCLNDSPAWVDAIASMVKPI
jgi:ferrochelatase